VVNNMDVMNLGSCELVNEFFKTESRRKQRFIRTQLKGGDNGWCYAKEHSAPRKGSCMFHTSG
jgi:hypothetical protein